MSSTSRHRFLGCGSELRSLEVLPLHGFIVGKPSSASIDGPA